MATTPYSFPHPSAATYPPPPFHGGPFPYPATTEIHGYTSAPDFYPSPFPLPLPPPPAYPYSPPTYEYTATTGFSPTPSTFVPSLPSPPPAYLYAPAASAYMDAYLYQSTPSSAQSWVVSAPSSALDSCVQEQVAPSSPAAAPTASIPPDEAAKNGHRNDNGPSPLPATAEIRDEFAHHDPTVGRVNNGSFGPCPASVLEEQGRWQHLYLAQPDAYNFHSLQPELVSAGDVSKISLVDNAIPTVPNQERQPPSSSTPRWLLDTVRTPPTRERTPLQSSFDSLHGELSKLSAAVSQFAAVMGLQTTETLVTSSSPKAPTQFRSQGNTASRSYMDAAASSSVNSFHSHSDAAANAYVAPEAFDTMSTPSSGCSKVFGKQSSAAANSSVNSFHSRSDAAASAYVTPEVFDKMPTPNAGYENCFAHPNQRPCVHGERTNLREQNLDYSLEQAAPATVFAVYDDKSDASSNEFIPMFTDTPEQVTDEEEKSKRQCFSKPTFSHERPTICVVGVFSLTNQLNPDYELCGKHVKPQVSNQQWNMLMTEAERKEWDPGTLKTIMFTSTSELLGKPFHKASANPSSEQLNCFSKVPETEHTSACLYNISDVQDFTFEGQPQDDQRTCSDPVRNASDSLAPRCSQLSIDQSMRDLKLQWDPGDTKFHILFRTAAGATRLQCTNIYKFELIHILSVQFGAKREPNFESAIMCSYAFGLGWTEVNIAAIFALVIPCFKGSACDRTEACFGVQFNGCDIAK